MRTLTVIIAAAALSSAACSKKKKDEPKPTPAAGPATGSGPGTAAGTGAGTAAGTGTGSAAVAEPTGVDPGMSNKAGNCPSSVAGARSELLDDKALPNTVVLSIVATDPAAVDTIRKRTAHLVAVQGAPDAEIKHSGEGTGGGAGMCPVVTAKDVTIASSEIANGVKVVLTPTGAMTAADLARDVVNRIDKMKGYAPGTPAGDAGGGGGAGGGSGDHGGNHSGDGDGKGKARDQAKDQAGAQ